VQVKLTIIDLGPRRAAEDGDPVIGRCFSICATTIVEMEASTRWRSVRRLERFFEPLVRAREVIRDDIGDELNPVRMSCFDKRLGIIDISKTWINAVLRPVSWLRPPRCGRAESVIHSV